MNTKLHGFEVDFKWPEHRLVVEVDGPHHQRARVKRDDAARDRILRAAGYRVLRFTDEDVYDRTDAVIRRTVAALAPSPGSRLAAYQRASWKMTPSAVRGPRVTVLTPWRMPTL